jgi:hypothetical protein
MGDGACERGCVVVCPRAGPKRPTGCRALAVRAPPRPPAPPSRRVRQRPPAAALLAPAETLTLVTSCMKQVSTSAFPRSEAPAAAPSAPAATAAARALSARISFDRVAVWIEKRPAEGAAYAAAADASAAATEEVEAPQADTSRPARVATSEAALDMAGARARAIGRNDEVVVCVCLCVCGAAAATRACV